MEISEKINIVEILIPFAGIVFFIAFTVVLLYQKFQKTIYSQELESEILKNKHQQELLYSMIDTQEKERKRIAQDLHDELGAVLSISRMQLMKLQKRDGDMEQVLELNQSAMTSIRRISHDLIPSQLLSMGWLEALQDLIHKANNSDRVKIQLDIEGEISNVIWLEGVNLFRIHAELINNTLKHANASEIMIVICRSETSVSCKYSDNGKQFSASRINYGKGLKGIENRVNSMNGELTFGNSKEGGFYSEFELPLAETIEEKPNNN